MTFLAFWLGACLALAALVNSVAALRETRRQTRRLDATLRLMLEHAEIFNRQADRVAALGQRTTRLELTQGVRVEMYS
jgi:hypothetical protein